MKNSVVEVLRAGSLDHRYSRLATKRLLCAAAPDSLHESTGSWLEYAPPRYIFRKLREITESLLTQIV